MFEIPDDDDGIFNDELLAPFLEPCSVLPPTKIHRETISATKESDANIHNVEKHSTVAAMQTTNTSSSMVMPVSEKSSLQHHYVQTETATSNQDVPGTPMGEQSNQHVVMQNGQTSNDAATLRRRHCSSNQDLVTPKRRKFPGPAGILPKLVSDQAFNMMSPSTLSPAIPQNKSPQEDATLRCSQSSEDLHIDTSWQALLKDLGDETFLKKFSISSTLLLASKKRLHQGKATLIFGRIETMESYASEASITLRDQSGRMQGTVHRDLLTDHEAELQVGTVLVLKQVSIISLSTRNHYLNITPNNVMAVYHCKQNKLRCAMFHGSQDSLHSVLSALEKQAASERSSRVNSLTGTPQSCSGSLSSRRSSTGTPQLFNRANTPQLFTSNRVNTPQQLFNSTRNTPTFRPCTPQLQRGTCPVGTSDARLTGHGNIYQTAAVQHTPPARYESSNSSSSSVNRYQGPPASIRDSSMDQRANSRNSENCLRSGHVVGQLRATSNEPALPARFTTHTQIGQLRGNGTPQCNSSIPHSTGPPQFNTTPQCNVPNTVRLSTGENNSNVDSVPNGRHAIHRTDSSKPPNTIASIGVANNLSNGGAVGNSRVVNIINRLQTGNGNPDSHVRATQQSFNNSSSHNSLNTPATSRLNLHEPHDDLNTSNGQAIQGQNQTVNQLANLTSASRDSIKLNTNNMNMSTPNVTTKSKWKFKSPTSAASSAASSPILGTGSEGTILKIPPVARLEQCAAGTIEEVFTKTPSKLQYKCFTQQSNISPIETSQYVFKATKCAKKDSMLEKENTPAADLWEDDLSDDLLSQLSEEMI